MFGVLKHFHEFWFQEKIDMRFQHNTGAPRKSKEIIWATQVVQIRLPQVVVAICPTRIHSDILGLQSPMIKPWKTSPPFHGPWLQNLANAVFFSQALNLHFWVCINGVSPKMDGLEWKIPSRSGWELGVSLFQEPTLCQLRWSLSPVLQEKLRLGDDFLSQLERRGTLVMTKVCDLEAVAHK